MTYYSFSSMIVCGIDFPRKKNYKKNVSKNLSDFTVRNEVPRVFWVLNGSDLFARIKIQAKRSNDVGSDLLFELAQFCSSLSLPVILKLIPNSTIACTSSITYHLQQLT